VSGLIEPLLEQHPLSTIGKGPVAVLARLPRRDEERSASARRNSSDETRSHARDSDQSGDQAARALRWLRLCTLLWLWLARLLCMLRSLSTLSSERPPAWLTRLL